MSQFLTPALPFLIFIVLLALLFLAERRISPAPLPTKPHLVHLLGALIMLWLCGYGMGVNMVLVLLFALPWHLHRLFKVRRQPILRRQALRNTAIWLTVFSSLILAHVHYARQARAKADHWVIRIDAFHAEQGRYPQPEEIGFANSSRAFDPYYLLKEDGTPLLFYRSSFAMFDTLLYDFKTREWALH